jgi:hypothetical protein
MNINLDSRARAIIAETLPLMERNRAPLEAALARYLARQAADPHDSDSGRVPAGAIMEMLLGHARPLGDGRPAAGLAETARQHGALGLGGDHYSAFGDGLKPIMRDVLGSKATSPVLAAWTDAYWAIVRRLFEQEQRLAA